MKLVYFIFVFTFFLCPNNLDLSQKQKVLNIYDIVKKFDNNSKLDHKELLQIVIPEFISFNENQDNFERYMIHLYYLSKSDRYKKISVGPFQMQIDFIFKNSTYSSYDEIVKDLNKLSTLENQYRILVNYVNNNKKLSLKQLTRKYNSGDPSKDFIFNKLKQKKTYYENSKDIITILY